MSKVSQTNNGIAVAAAFAVLGLLMLYVWPNIYSVATAWIASAFVVFGVLGFFVELSKVVSVKKYRVDNLGVGFVLLAPALFGIQYVYASDWIEWIKMILATVLLACVLFGAYGILDFLMSVFESAKDVKQKLIDSAKFLAVVVPALAAVIVAVHKILELQGWV